MTKDLEEELNNFKFSHYKNADFDSFTDKIKQLYSRFEKIKDIKCTPLSTHKTDWFKIHSFQLK